jgi:histidine phosphotransferase ChpT
MLVDHRVAQLLCSRLCHDIAGPAGAVSTGLELIDDGAGDVADEALDLVRRSARQVIARLSFLRIAFGSAGIGSVTTLTEMKALASEHLDGGLVALDWPLDDLLPPTTQIAPPGGMLILNMLLIGVDALPRGGNLEVRFADVGGAFGLAMTAKGQGAVLRPEIRDAMRLDTDVASLSARTVPAYCVSKIAGDLGVAIEISDGDDREVLIAAILPGD